ncbi:MAG: hypothetical protein AB8H80_14905 [Planctomycetota bacterium]
MANPDTSSPSRGSGMQTSGDPVIGQLRPLLTRQLKRLRTRYLWYGLGKALLWVAALVLLFFVLDRWLELPTPIRLFHTVATIAVAGYTVVHFLRYPLGRRFGEVDLALWLEHTYPDLHQRLVSAVQLHDVEPGELRNQSRAMIQKLWEETAASTSSLDLDALFDNRALRRVLGGALLLVAVLVGGALLAPQSARIFALRHLGVSVDYPRDTTLIVELPPAGPDLQRQDDGAESTLILPAGADLHISVLAQGVVPDEAFLDVEPLRQASAAAGSGGGNDSGANADAELTQSGSMRSVPMTPRPGDRFRHVFRRVSGSFRFRARGGDDDRGDRLVIVQTVRPAQVATLRAEITPPAYTGIDSVEQNGGAIEALEKSEVQLTLRATAPVRTATMVFLESGRKLELEPVTMEDDGGTVTAFAGRFFVTQSDRYQIELVAANGLRNPNPGTYPISALQDYAPVGRWLLPEDDTLALLPEALLCLRVHARDDFGLTAVNLVLEHAGKPVLEDQLLLPAQAASESTATAAAGDEGAQSDARSPREALLTRIFEVKDLLGGSESAGEGLFARVVLRDNQLADGSGQQVPTRQDPTRQDSTPQDPAGGDERQADERQALGTAELPRRIVQIVDRPQLSALIAKSFRRLREEITQAYDIQNDRMALLDTLLEPPAVPEPAPADPSSGSKAPRRFEVGQVLTGIEVGQGRIASSVQRTHRGLMRAFDLHLWNRLESSQHQAEVVELYRAHSAAMSEPLALDPQFYRDLHQRRSDGTLGALETVLDPILAMIVLTDRLALEDGPRVQRLLAEAQVARDAKDRTPLLQDVRNRQEKIAETLQQLLLRLEEWNDYQDLVQEVRALRDRQRELQGRTEEARGK